MANQYKTVQELKLPGVLKLKFQQLDFDVIKNARHPKIEFRDGWARVKQD